MKFVNDCLTGKDNLTYDAGRVIGLLGALMYVIFWAVQVSVLLVAGTGSEARAPQVG